ncbi:MAG TPA: ABC transporter permease subunit [Planctomycetota bacterium]|nr:ABC transporter permease subunit [Planctomycetota bacterium]
MKQTLVVAGKELRSSLSSPVAYVFLGIFTVASWFFFFHVEKFFAFDEASLRGFFHWLPMLLLGLAPPLTMRLWADERRLGTWEILATTPVPVGSLVLGKFLAALGLVILGLVFTASLPLVAGAFGDLDLGPVFGGYFGAILLGGAFVAIGLVCSSLVQDQFVALVLGWTGGLLMMLPGFGFWEGLVGRNAAEALRLFGFEARFDAAARGLIDLRDVAFYASTISFFLVLNTALVRARRYTA